MECLVRYTDEFREWWNNLSLGEQESVRHIVEILSRYGLTLGFPYSSGVSGSRFSRMRELRIQHEGRPYRVLYAFDPNQDASTHRW
jgi:hypothetical protein